MGSGTPRILVVDDEIDNCRNLADILSDLGYQVDTASDGPTALEMVRGTHYDVALLDLMMPGMDGATLYAELKRERADIVAMIVTAYPENPRAAAAISAGAWKVVPKPVEFPNLLTLVEEAVGQPLVLVVDDDHHLCLNLWDILREQGYRVSLAHDERTAIERLRDERFTVILLDMKLPDGDGASVFRQARQLDSQAQVVVITGVDREVETRINDILAAGAQGVVYKPFNVSELIEIVQGLTAAKEPMPEGPSNT